MGCTQNEIQETLFVHTIHSRCSRPTWSDGGNDKLNKDTAVSVYPFLIYNFQSELRKNERWTVDVGHFQQTDVLVKLQLQYEPMDTTVEMVQS